MALIQITNTFIANTRARAAEVNRNFSDVVGILAAHHHDPNIYTNAVPITNSGIAQNAQILDTQMKMNITRSGLINPSSIQNGWPAGGIPASAIPFNLGQKQFSRVELTNAFTYIERDSSTGELALTDAVNGTKRVSQLGNVKFGGDGTDGDLSITSGTTTLDIANAAVFTKNYTSISITGTGKLAFSNPNTNGSIVVLKSQGNVTLTSSQAPMIDCSGLGGIGGTARTGVTTQNGETGSSGYGFGVTTSGGRGGSASSSATNTQTENGAYTKLTSSFTKYAGIAPGSGGGSGMKIDTTGDIASGVGGRGGGALVIECGGAFNFTTTGGISVAGMNGTNFTGSSGSGYAICGGGGGGGGCLLVIYITLTANSGTVTVSGGTAGTGGTNGSPGSNYSASNGGNSIKDPSTSGSGSTTASTDGANGLAIFTGNKDFS